MGWGRHGLHLNHCLRQDVATKAEGTGCSSCLKIMHSLIRSTLIGLISKDGAEGKALSTSVLGSYRGKLSRDSITDAERYGRSLGPSLCCSSWAALKCTRGSYMQGILPFQNYSRVSQVQAVHNDGGCSSTFLCASLLLTVAFISHSVQIC